MLAEPPVWITNILEQHVEDLDAFWKGRAVNAVSPTYTRRALKRQDARILAHVDALVLAGDEAVPLVVPAMAAGYGGAVTGTLVLLLADARKHAAAVLTAFETAGGPILEGMVQGMVWAGAGAMKQLKDPLLALAKAGPTPVAAAAVAVLAAHNMFRPSDAPLDAWLGHADPAMRIAAWRAAQNIAVPRSLGLYQAGLNDADAAVRAEAMTAMAWAGQKSLVTQCRLAAQKPALAGLPLLEMFAVIAEAGDAPLILGLAKAEVLGPARFGLLGRSGFPGAAPVLLAAMKGKDAAAAAAAGGAFVTLTGFDASTGTRVSLATSNDPFEQAFAEEVALSDPAAAEAFWKGPGASMASLPRIAGGIAVDPAIAPVPENLLPLDCRGFVDVHVRHYFQTGQAKRALELLAFSTTPA